MASQDSAVFAIGDANGRPMLLLGMHDDAIARLHRRETLTFDLKPVGLDIQIIMFYEATREECIALIKAMAAGPITDLTDKEFPVK